MPIKLKDVPGCAGCPLAAKFPDNSFVPVRWGSSDRLVVGEAAGMEESLAGQPFVGASGKLLQSLYRKAGVQWSSLTVVNTLSCKPLDNKYPTSPDARSYCTKQEADEIVAHCHRAHLEPVLNARPWKRIDALGDHALLAVTGEKGISKYRGFPMEPKSQPGKFIVMPTIHPAYAMRVQELLPAIVSDLKKTMVLPPENYNLYPSLDEVRAFTSKYVVLDIETEGFTRKISMVGIAAKPYEVMVVPWKSVYIPEIKRILLDAEEIVTHNGCQFDIPILCEALNIEYP